MPLGLKARQFPYNLYVNIEGIYTLSLFQQIRSCHNRRGLLLSDRSMYQLERTVALASKEELKNENESTHSVLPFPDLFHAVDVERCGARLLIGFSIR
jgi:hypothetical protein